MLTWVLAAALALPVPAPPEPPPVPADWETVTAVPPELDAQVQAWVVKPAPRQDERLRRLVELMFAPDGLAFGYDNATTRTVAETLRDHRGNCLSFTLAFVVMARRAGLDAYIQQTDDVLVWPGGADTNTVFHSGHVNAGVHIGGKRYTVDFEPNLTLSRNRPRRIEDRIALAHFNNNRGVELMEQGDLPAARRHFEAALATEPDFLFGLNNLGVLMNRSGDPAAAERIYRSVLEREPRNMPALSNLVNLYRQQGRTDGFGHYQRLLERIERRDPYRNFIVGLQHERAGAYPAALNAYKRAVKLHRREPQFHLALARVYTHMGKARAAERARARAESLANGRPRAARDFFADFMRERELASAPVLP